MKCPYCGYIDTKVVDSRAIDEGVAIRRRRSCGKCNERFTTFERLEQLELVVIKRDGTSEIFDPSKLKSGLLKSCNKRLVSMKQIDAIVKEIEASALNSMKMEITSNEIGEFVMDKLKEIDEVSYVRFASVYRKFEDIENFKAELDRLYKEKIDREEKQE